MCRRLHRSCLLGSYRAELLLHSTSIRLLIAAANASIRVEMVTNVCHFILLLLQFLLIQNLTVKVCIIY